MDDDHTPLRLQPRSANRASSGEVSGRPVLPSPSQEPPAVSEVSAFPPAKAEIDIDAELEAVLEGATEAKPVQITEARAYPMHAAGDKSRSLDEIPEAVALDEIPAAVTEKAPPLRIRQEPGKVRRVKKLPEKRDHAPGEYQPPPPPENLKPIEKSKFVSFDQFKKGEMRAEPLERVPGEGRERAPAPRPKFMDGELPRSVERGVRHPQPGLVRFSAFMLLLTKLLFFANLVALPIIAIVAPESFSKNFWLPLAFFVIGLVFLIWARKCRCRVCSCHFFFTKRCFKHRSAHRLRILGFAGSAALHVLLFRWMRCMYCGTAIRMRPAPEDEEVGLK